MSIDARQLRMSIIRRTLEEMDVWSMRAENMLMGTCAQESAMGTYIKQLGGGPALGIYQMEPRTHDDIWDNVISPNKKHSWYMEDELRCAGRMVYDLKYATKMIRYQYLRFAEPFPHASDIEGLAKYWKKYYNTSQGKGTVEQFVASYHKYVGDSDELV